MFNIFSLAYVDFIYRFSGVFSVKFVLSNGFFEYFWLKIWFWFLLTRRFDWNLIVFDLKFDLELFLEGILLIFLDYNLIKSLLKRSQNSKKFSCPLSTLHSSKKHESHVKHVLLHKLPSKENVINTCATNHLSKNKTEHLSNWFVYSTPLAYWLNPCSSHSKYCTQTKTLENNTLKMLFNWLFSQKASIKNEDERHKSFYCIPFYSFYGFLFNFYGRFIALGRKFVPKGFEWNFLWEYFRNKNFFLPKSKLIFSHFSSLYRILCLQEIVRE